MTGTMLQLTSCPECDAPAEITDRTVLASTDGPIEHVKIRCINRHWFLLPLYALDPVQPVPTRRAMADERHVIAPRHPDR